MTLGQYFENPWAAEPLSLWVALPPWTAIPNAVDVAGWGGHGLFAHRLPALLWALPYAVLWVAVRSVLKGTVFPKMAELLKVKQTKRAKLSTQMWLLTYYIATVSLGAIFLRDEPWFQFPMTKDGIIAVLWPASQQPTAFVEWYYCFQLGFYVAEIFAIFNEPRRSDFIEYSLHHVITIFLIGFSSLALEMRIGAYVLFLHDIPDIFLCAAKASHYVLNEAMAVLTNVLLLTFVVTFYYLRMYCLPVLSYYAFTVATQVRPASTFTWALLYMLGFALQGLHVFWAVLIVRMMYNVVRGTAKGDVRSDDDLEEGEVAAEKKAVTEGRREKSRKTA